MTSPWRRCGPACVAALLLGQSGCSLIFLKAPEPPGDARVPTDCSTSAVPPVLDVLCALAGFSYTAAAFALRPMACPGDSCAGITGVGVAGAALGTLCAISAATGASRAARCSELKALQRRCSAGDAAACWGPVPVAVPVPES